MLGVGIVAASPASPRVPTSSTPLRSMTIDVPALPRAALRVQSLTARGEAPYLEAAEELRAEVTIAAGFAGLPDTPLRPVAITYMLYTGKNRQDGYTRIRRAHLLWWVLDPIRAALRDAGVIATLGAIDSERVACRRHDNEGWRIHLQEVDRG